MVILNNDVTIPACFLFVWWVWALFARQPYWLNMAAVWLRAIKAYFLVSTTRKLHVSSIWSPGMAQWWEHSPPTNVAWVRFPDSASYVGWVCWFSTHNIERFPPGTAVSRLLKNQHFKTWFALLVNFSLHGVSAISAPALERLDTYTKFLSFLFLLWILYFVARTKPHTFAPLEHKIYIFSPPCNIRLHVISSIYLKRHTYGLHHVKVVLFLVIS